MKLVAALPAIALGVLAGCATQDRVTPAPAPVVVNPPAASSSTVVVPPQSSVAPPAAVVVAPAPAPLQVGYGHVETIVPVPRSAASGGTVPDSHKRVGIRMDNGVVQYLDTDATGLSVGDRVQITTDGYMRRPA